MSVSFRVLLLALLQIGFASLVGCSVPTPPEGYAVVREHVVYAPRNDPPIRSNLDFTILAVDGAAAQREKPPPFVDMQPGVLVTAGTHRFTARVSPHMRSFATPPREISFVATVVSGKAYDLVDNEEGAPVLIEVHPAAQ